MRSMTAVAFLAGLWAVGAGLAPAAVVNTYDQAMSSQTDLIHYWPLDNLNVDDAVGSLDGPATNNISAVPDVLGRADAALYFSGSGSVVDYGDNLTLPDQGTLEAFVRVDDKSAPQGYFISSRTSGSANDRFYLAKDGGGNVYGRIGGVGNTTVLTSGTYDQGAWRYVAFTWEKDGSNFNLKTYYADNDGLVKQHASRTGGGTAPAGGPLEFGRYAVADNEYIQGAMDNVAIYETPLSVHGLHNHFALATYTAGQLQSNYQEMILGTPGLIHYWPLDNQASEDVVGSIDRGGRVDLGSTTGPGSDPASAILLNGTSSQVRFDDNPLTLGNTGTLEMWVRADDAPADRGYAFSARKTEGGTQADRLYVTAWDKGAGEGDELRFGFGDNADAGQIANIEGRLGDWIYVALTWEEQAGGEIDVRTYFSGEDGLIHAGGVDLGNVGFAPTDALMRLGLYSDGGSQFFPGAVDEVAIYDRALSMDEMQMHYMTLVPEPATVGMFVTGVLLLGLIAWRRRGTAAR